ncbi:hypothetical protein BHM03_00053526, partial [Ensete ventricosum]
ILFIFYRSVRPSIPSCTDIPYHTGQISIRCNIKDLHEILDRTSSESENTKNLPRAQNSRVQSMEATNSRPVYAIGSAGTIVDQQSEDNLTGEDDRSSDRREITYTGGIGNGSQAEVGIGRTPLLSYQVIAPTRLGLKEPATTTPASNHQRSCLYLRDVPFLRYANFALPALAPFAVPLRAGAKRFPTCKFSHDLYAQRKGERIDLYSDQRGQELPPRRILWQD